MPKSHIEQEAERIVQYLAAADGRVRYVTLSLIRGKELMHLVREMGGDTSRIDVDVVERLWK